nr:laforin-like [Taeniopygia guttata]
MSRTARRAERGARGGRRGRGSALSGRRERSAPGPRPRRAPGRPAGLGQDGSAARARLRGVGRAGTRVGRAGTRVGRAGTRVGRTGIRVGRAGTRVGRAGTRVGRAGTRVGRAGTRVGRAGRGADARGALTGRCARRRRVPGPAGAVRAPAAAPGFSWEISPSPPDVSPVPGCRRRGRAGTSAARTGRAAAPAAPHLRPAADGIPEPGPPLRTLPPGRASLGGRLRAPAYTAPARSISSRLGLLSEGTGTRKGLFFHFFSHP